MMLLLIISAGIYMFIYKEFYFLKVNTWRRLTLYIHILGTVKNKLSLIQLWYRSDVSIHNTLYMCQILQRV